jgi:O-antigen/teichoic acid export membrane protein
VISRSFIKSSLIYTLSGALPMASAIILLPFYTQHLSTDVLGALWIYLAFTLLVQIVVTFSYDTSIYIHFHDYKNDLKNLSQFISSAFTLILLIGTVTTIILSLSGGMIFDLVFSDRKISFYPYGLIAALTGLFQSLFKVYSSLLQTQQKAEQFFRSNLLNFSLIAGSTIVGLQFFPNSLMGPIGGRLLASIISGGWSIGRIYSEFGFHFNRNLLKSAFNFNFYAFIYQLQQWVVNYFDRIVISWFLTLDQVGVYGFAVSCLLAIEFVANGLYSSFAPQIISIISTQKEKTSSLEINRYFHGLTVVVMLLVTICILFFPVLIDLFISNPDYKLAIQYIPYISIIYLFKSMRLYFNIPYGILKYTKPLPVIYLIVSATKIGAMFIFIKSMGIYGVVLSSLLSYWVEVILLYMNGKDRFKFDFNILKIIVAPVALAVVIAVVDYSFGTMYPLVVHIFYLTACLFLIALAYKKEIQLVNPLKMLN